MPVLEPGQVEDLRAIADTLAATGKDAMNIAQLLTVTGKDAMDMAQESRTKLARVGSAPPPMKSMIMGESKVVEAETGLKVAEKVVETPQIKPLEPKVAPKSPTPNNGGDIRVSAPQQVILNTLAELVQLGVASPLREQVAKFADVSAKSSGYGNNLGALRSAGLIDYPAPGQLALTEAGTSHAAPSQRPLTLAALQSAWLRRLPSPQAKLLGVLIDCYPVAVTRVALAQSAEVSAASSGYGNNLGALRSLGLVSYPQLGHVLATSLLFPVGLADDD